MTTSTPACNSIINTQPTDFVINLSDPVDPNTVQATDFTVNGTPANSFVSSNGNATITFHFNSSPVVTQGPQTMHIPAGAFNQASNNDPNFEFNCSFCYAVTPLQVTNTVPPDGGTFSPAAPGDYQYDVNFNQAVDPGSVQTSDLTLTGNVGGSVTNCRTRQRQQTARFTVHFNFGGSVTASIGAGAITAVGCNPNAAFTGNYTVEGCPPANHYDIAQIGGSIEPGSTDTGNHGDDQTTTIALPFSYSVYDQTFNSITVSSNGNAQFTTTDAALTNDCLPWPTHDYTIFPYWDDQRTECGCRLPRWNCGIFTSVSGTAPNRIFNIEWRTVYFNAQRRRQLRVALVRGPDTLRCDLRHGRSGQHQRHGVECSRTTAPSTSTSATARVVPQLVDKATSCRAAEPRLRRLRARPSATPTATATATATPTGTPTATATATATSTARPTPTPRSAPTPRPRPTPPPRP